MQFFCGLLVSKMLIQIERATAAVVSSTALSLAPFVLRFGRIVGNCCNCPMEPTEEERIKMKLLSHVCEWIPFLGDSCDSFLTHIGATPHDPVRLVGFIDEESFAELINSWQVDDRAPSPMEMSRAGLLGKIARSLCGNLAKVQKGEDSDTVVELQKQVAELKSEDGQPRCL